MTTGASGVKNALAKSGQAVATYLREEITLVDLAILTARVQAKVFTLLAEADDISVQEFSDYFHYSSLLLTALQAEEIHASEFI